MLEVCFEVIVAAMHSERFGKSCRDPRSACALYPSEMSSDVMRLFIVALLGQEYHPSMVPRGKIGDENETTAMLSFLSSFVDDGAHILVCDDIP